MLDALALGGEQLDELGAAVLLGGSEDLREVGAELGLMRHLHSFTSPGLRDHLARVGICPRPMAKGWYAGSAAGA